MHGGRNINLTMTFSHLYVALLCGVAVRLSVKELYYETLQQLILSSIFQVMNFMKTLDPE